MNTMRAILVLNEIAKLEGQIEKLKAEIPGLLGNSPASSSRKPTARVETGGTPVAERVRKILGRGNFTFGEVFSMVCKGGPAKRESVKSAINKGRERGDYDFDGERYGMKVAKPAPAPVPAKKPAPKSKKPQPPRGDQGSVAAG